MIKGRTNSVCCVEIAKRQNGMQAIITWFPFHVYCGPLTSWTICIRNTCKWCCHWMAIVSLFIQHLHSWLQHKMLFPTVQRDMPVWRIFFGQVWPWRANSSLFVCFICDLCAFKKCLYCSSQFAMIFDGNCWLIMKFDYSRKANSQAIRSTSQMGFYFFLLIILRQQPNHRIRCRLSMHQSSNYQFCIE